MRAIAAAPAKVPPPRLVTAVVVQPGDAAPQADQFASIRARIDADAEVSEREGKLVLVFADAMRAAEAALELRNDLPATRVALATGVVAPGSEAVAEIIGRALALVGEGGRRIRIDDETAKRVQPKFDVGVNGEDGKQVYLVEPLASGTPRQQKTIGNYRIVRLLGTGGMGVVYLAEHVAIGRKAVIKFVQEKLESKELATRFFLEAKTTAAIRHPGIVDVFDYGQDETGRHYIVMEYLEGESLRVRLRREKPLPLDVAIALGTQMASALGAAHAAGVIHRDLKPDNVFLVTDPEARDRVRSKVLDFGLAKMPDSGDTGLTQTGNFVGTPLYMSPEQCRSNTQTDHRTDIYSLGCVLFEMVTGRPPFLDKTVGDLIIAHNTTPPPLASSLREDVPHTLERLIARTLAKHAGDRFQSMEELGDELGRIAKTLGKVRADDTPVARPRRESAQPTPSAEAPEIVAPPQSLPEQRRPSRTKWIALGVGGAVVASLVAFFALRDPAKNEATKPPADPNRRAIAVLQLDNQSGSPDTAWLATALSVVLTRDLADGLRVVPVDDVTRMKSDRNLTGPWTRERLGEVRAALGIDYAIVGGYVALGAKAGGQLRLDLDLVDTTTGAVVEHISETGTETDLFALGTKVDAAFKRHLGVAASASSTSVGLLPKNAAAVKPYAEALAKLQSFDVTGARTLLEQAAAIDPEDPAIHFALARVWSELGYDAKAATEAKLAYDRASGLTREYQLAIEAKYRETTGQWDQAVTSYKTLFEFFPQNLDYGLALVAAQTRAGDAKSAYVTLDALRKLGSDPRIDLAEAVAAESADDAERERAAAERAAFLANKTGARLLLAKARFKQGWAEFTLGRDSDAAKHYEEARKIFAEVGDRSGLARVLNNMALVAHRAHRDDEAAKLFEESLAIAREIQDTIAEAWVLNNWAYLVTDQGDLDRAIKLYQEKIALSGKRGVPPASLAAAHANIAEIARWRGDLATAREHCNTADDLVRGVDARRFAAFAAYQCGELMRADDDLAGARKRITQALGWASDTGNPEAAEIRTGLARLELDAGNHAEAETTVRKSLEDLRAAKEGSQQVCAIAVLATTLLVTGRAEDAQKELDVIAKLPKDGVSRACQIEAGLAAARVIAAGDKEAGLAALTQVRDRAQKAGLIQHTLLARLALGKTGAPGELPGLAKEAAAKGFKLIARQAREKK
ncbi:MAG: protein kinase [Myxococcota bacterium]|nr:protein kinase [Myxococcota bacterium]